MVTSAPCHCLGLTRGQDQMVEGIPGAQQEKNGKTEDGDDCFDVADDVGSEIRRKLIGQHERKGKRTNKK